MNSTTQITTQKISLPMPEGVNVQTLEITPDTAVVMFRTAHEAPPRAIVERMREAAAHIKAAVGRDLLCVGVMGLNSLETLTDEQLAREGLMRIPRPEPAPVTDA